MRDGDDLGPVTYSTIHPRFRCLMRAVRAIDVNDSAKMSAEHGYCTQVARNRTKFNTTSGADR